MAQNRIAFTGSVEKRADLVRILIQRLAIDLLNRLEPRRRHIWISPRITRINANRSERRIRNVGFRAYALRFRNAFILQTWVVPKIYEKTKFKSGCVQVIQKLCAMFVD